MLSVLGPYQSRRCIITLISHQVWELYISVIRPRDAGTAFVCIHSHFNHFAFLNFPQVNIVVFWRCEQAATVAAAGDGRHGYGCHGDVGGQQLGYDR